MVADVKKGPVNKNEPHAMDSQRISMMYLFQEPEKLWNNAKKKKITYFYMHVLHFQITNASKEQIDWFFADFIIFCCKKGQSL